MVPIDSIASSRPLDTRRFWLGVALLVAGLVAASAWVVAQGSHAGVRARALLPAPGSEASVRPAIRVAFARQVERASVEGAVAIAPEVPFDLSWSENELRIVPRAPLRSETGYTVTIGPGVRDAQGGALAGQLQWQFRTRAPRVVFLRPTPAGTAELWTVALDGQGAERLSAPGQSVLDWDAAGDGSSLVYTVEEGPNTVNLWRVVPGRAGLTQLTREQGVVYGAPRFSPAGDLLAVEVRRVIALGDQGSQLAPPAIELRRPADGSPAGVVYGEGQAAAHTPRWSRDGTRLAFFEAIQNAVGIFNFTGETAFFPGESASLGPQTWAPDGRALVHSKVLLFDGGAQQVVAVRDLQLGTELLHGERVGDQADPAWHPDGTIIAYAFRPPPDVPTGGGIWIMRPDGTGRLLLVSEPEAILSQPLWSPDGEWLLFARFNLADPAAEQSLWAIRRNGSDLRQVAPAGFQPGWLP